MIWPGPFWFFALMMQFYLLYRLMLHRRHWGVTMLVMALCVLVQLQLNPMGETMNRYRYNFMGGMLPFGLGLLYARFQNKFTLWRRSRQAVGRPFDMYAFGLLPQSEFRGVDLYAPSCMPFGALNSPITGSRHVFGLALSRPLLDG